MRGDALMTVRLLLRRSGLAGTLAALAGVAAVVATRLPWYVAVTDVHMLGAEQGRAVAALEAFPGTAAGWMAVAAGVAALVLGAGIAVDRPLPRARVGLALAATTLAAAAVLAYLATPGLGRIAGGEAARLAALADRLPLGVSLDLRIARGPGPASVLLAAVAVGVGAAAARER